MKGIIKGFEPVDYVSKKTGKPVKGATIYYDCKNKSTFGYLGKEEYIAADSPIYKRVIEPLLEKFYDEDSEVYGGIIELDQDVIQRGNASFKELLDMTITPRSVAAEHDKPAKKAG